MGMHMSLSIHCRLYYADDTAGDHSIFYTNSCMVERQENVCSASIEHLLEAIVCARCNTTSTMHGCRWRRRWWWWCWIYYHMPICGRSAAAAVVLGLCQLRRNNRLHQIEQRKQAQREWGSLSKHTFTSNVHKRRSQELPPAVKWLLCVLYWEYAPYANAWYRVHTLKTCSFFFATSCLAGLLQSEACRAHGITTHSTNSCTECTRKRFSNKPQYILYILVYIINTLNEMELDATFWHAQCGFYLCSIICRVH